MSKRYGNEGRKEEDISQTLNACMESSDGKGRVVQVGYMDSIIGSIVGKNIVGEYGMSEVNSNGEKLIVHRKKKVVVNSYFKERERERER